MLAPTALLIPRDCVVCGNQPYRRDSLLGEGRDGERIVCAYCGTYTTDILAENWIGDKSMDDRRYLLSGVLRNASEAGRPLNVSTQNLETLLAAARPPATLLRVLDPVLVFVARSTPNFAEPFVIDGSDFPRFFLRSQEELGAVLHQLAVLGWIAALTRSPHRIEWTSRLTINGWRRFEEIEAAIPDSRQAFVAMWFSTELDDAWLHGIRPALRECGYNAFRVDAQEHNGKIDDMIMAELRRSALIVADFTGHRGGVYFEAGFGLGRGIPVIWTARRESIEASHFDTRQYNHIVWDSAEDLRSKLRTRIMATLPVFPALADPREGRDPPTP